ncbi:MAG: choice-of-anchor L domain-containing protein [Bacteroidota bacterium]
MRLIKQTALLFALSFLWTTASAQLVVNTALTPAQWVSILTGPGVLVSNITYTGLPVQAGQFTASGTNLGITNGIMLSTANCSLSIGPNLQDDASEDLLQPGDPVLDAQAGTSTFDAAILEFDFIPQNDTVRFRYVFASEEYPEYVCSVFNDAFAFQISGPGYATPTNIAFIPGSTTPVAINTVNVGSAGTNGSSAASCDTSNAQYYVDNTGGATIQLDGFTVPLIAQAIVVPCQTYHLRISIADAGDGEWDSSVFFEAGSLSSTPVVDAGVDRAFCGPGSATIGFPGASGWTYSWSPSAGLSNANIANPTVTVSGTTSVTTSYVLTATNGSCVLRDTVVVTAGPPPVAAFTTTSACQGSPVSINFTGTAPAGATYTWGFGGGTVISGSGPGPYSVSYASIGNYTVTLQVAVGTCTSSAPSQAVVIHPVQTAPLATIDDVSCSGEADGIIVLTPQGGTPPFTAAWVPNISNNLSAVSLAPGSYDVILSDANGCTISASYSITEPLPLTAQSTGVPALCAGTPSGTVTASAQGGTTPYFYQWTTTGDTTASIVGVTAGDYTCTITDGNGCTATTVATVAPQIVVAPQVVATPGTICPGGSVTLSVSGAASYVWSDGSLDSVRTLSPSQTETYDVVATDANGCTGTGSATISVYPEPQAAFAAAAVCYTSPTQFIQQSTIASGAISVYDWNFGDGNSSSGIQPSHTYASPGNYDVSLRVVSDNGCVDSITTTVVTHPLPVASWSSGIAAGCVPWPVEFRPQPASGTIPIVSYSWNIGGVSSSQPTPDVIFDVPGDYSVRLMVTDSNGCTDDSLTIDHVHAYPVPAAGFTITPVTVSEFFPRVALTDASSGAVEWLWDFGDTTTSAEQEPSHSYTNAGIYTVRQVVRNTYGCIDTLVRTLEVGRDYAFYIPNAFTPNGDGANDVFEVKGYNFYDYRIEIFNRWGKQVFISEDPLRSWDGTQRGEFALEGVYDYIVTFNDVFGASHKLYGRVTLIR